jgi:hypothetical protein
MRALRAANSAPAAPEVLALCPNFFKVVLEVRANIGQDKRQL